MREHLTKTILMDFPNTGAVHTFFFEILVVSMYHQIQTTTLIKCKGSSLVPTSSVDLSSCSTVASHKWLPISVFWSLAQNVPMFWKAEKPQICDTEYYCTCTHRRTISKAKNPLLPSQPLTNPWRTLFLKLLTYRKPITTTCWIWRKKGWTIPIETELIYLVIYTEE